MGGLIDIERARALVSDRMLWPRVRDFLWDFTPQVHPSWLESLPGCAMSDASDAQGMALVPSLMSSPRTKRFILSSLGVEPCFHAFPKEDWSRLLLLDGTTLESSAKWMGALVCAGALRRLTDGATVRALKAALPGVYPDVFAYTAYFNRWIAGELERLDGGSSGGSPVDRLVRCGMGSLFSFLAELPAPLQRRLRLKLPKTFSESVSDDPIARRFDDAAVSKLLKLKFSEAHALCCS